MNKVNLHKMSQRDFQQVPVTKQDSEKCVEYDTVFIN